MFHKTPTIYIGYDPSEEIYCDVLKKSIEANTKDHYNIVPIVQSEVRRAGLYWRSGELSEHGMVDTFDRKPFSTEFSFTRFLVPMLNQYSGLALFMDCDMYVRSDITEIFDTHGANHNVAISCVQHNHNPTEVSKMDGKVQTLYNRKNWSSFVLWNLDHPATKELTIGDVNTKPGSWLHGFYWLETEHIGNIKQEWNWLDGHSPENIEPKNVHFTTGGPVYKDWKPTRKIDGTYAKEWKDFYLDRLKVEKKKHD